MSGLAEVLAAHEYMLGIVRGGICICGFVPEVDPSTLQTQQDYHRAHVAAAVTAWLTELLASEETAQRGAAVYWNHRQGVPLDAWTPPIEVESMQAALIAVTAALRGES